MRLSFAIFLSGVLVVVAEAAEPTRSLQWQRRGKWYQRDGVDLNSTQSLPAQQAPARPPSGPGSISGLPSISSAPAFPPSIVSQSIVSSSSSSGLGAAFAADGAPSSSSTEQSSSSGVPPPSGLPKNNPIASNTSDEQSSSSSSSSASSSSDVSSSSSLSSFPTLRVQDNSTGVSSASDSTVTAPPFPQLNTTATGFNDTGVGRNVSTCGGCVVNAQGLVDWWFPANVFLDIASISTIQLNGTSSFSAVPLSTFTDINDQLSQETFMLTTSTDPVAGTTTEDYVFTTLPPPIAASTSITTISDINPLPTGTFGSDALASINADPSTPSIVVDPAIPTAISATQVDNIAWYTAYEVEFEQSTTDDSGASVCQKATSTFTLDEPYAYTLDPAITFGDSAVATGPVDPAFLNYIPFATCTTGTWTAAPTMIVVVEVAIQRGFNVFLVHHEVSDPGSLDTPTVTADGGGGAAQTSDSTNVVSAVATVGGNTVTFQATVTGNPASVTVPVGGSSVVASVIGGGSGNSGNQNNNNNNGGGGVASAIISALGGGSQNNGNANGGNNNNGAATGVGGAIGNIINPTGGGNAPAGSVNGVGFASSTTAAAGGGVPVITVGGQTFVGNQATEFSLAPGATLTPGGVATVGSNTVSLASNAQSIVVNGATSQLVVPAAPAPTAIAFQGSTVTANSQGAFVISGQSLVAGGQQITVGSNTISLNANGETLTVNGLPITAPATLPTAAPIIQIDGTTFQAQGGGESFIIGGQTLVQGQQIVAGTNTISLASDGSFAVVNGVTQAVTGITVAPAINVGGTQFTENQGGFFIISGTTVRPGQTSVIAGTTVGFGSDGSFVVINGRTSSLSLSTIPALVIGGTTYAVTTGAAGYVIGGQTLKPGQVITANGHTISLSGDGKTVVVDGLTTVLTPSSTLPPLITIDGTVFTANSGTTYNIDGHILTPGGCIKDGTHSICLAPHATALTVDGVVTKLFPAASTPAKVSAVATSSSAFKSSTGSSNSQATATSTKKGAASSISINYGLTFVATLLSFFGALSAWI